MSLAFPVGHFSRKGCESIKHSTARLNIWEGAVRSSKTFNSIVRWVIYVKMAPAGPLIMVGRTERTLHENVLEPMAAMLGRSFQHTLGTGFCYIFHRRVLLRGANDMKAEQKIRGLTLAGAYVDEITIMPESFFAMLLSRLSVRGAKLFGTTNPDGPMHWLKVHYLDRADTLDLRTWHFILEDNPNLPPEYVAALKAEYASNRLYYRRFILGEWCQAEGAVYDRWNEDEHVISTLPAARAHYVAIDYGTSNPCAFLLLGWTPEGFTVEKEYYWASKDQGRQKSDSEYADDLIAFCQGTPIDSIIVDPSAASFRAELATRGIVTFPATNAVVDGIRAVSSLLAEGRLHVHGSCINLRREMAAYVWDETAPVDRPKKENDHTCDALRYCIATLLIPVEATYVLERPEPLEMLPF